MNNKISSIGKKLLFIFFFFSISYQMIYSQYAGGDFVISNSERETTTTEIIQELEQIIKVLYISGYHSRQTDCLKNKQTKKKTYKVLQQLKNIVPLLPENYSILVIGHADQTGHEYSMRGSHGNDYYSTLRAISVANLFVKEYPIIKKKLLIGGAGSRKNERMVTFQITPQDKAKKIHDKLIRKYGKFLNFKNK